MKKILTLGKKIKSSKKKGGFIMQFKVGETRGCFSCSIRGNMKYTKVCEKCCYCESFIVYRAALILPGLPRYCICPEKYYVEE